MGYKHEKRPLRFPADSIYRSKIITSTSASTALTPAGVYALQTAVTSSGAPVVYTLNVPKAGDQLRVVAHTVVSSSVAPFHINAQTSGAFSYATGSTAQDMVTLATMGAGFEAIALNATEWLVTGIRSATFSTST